ncbi:MAG TPA: hypothetical protein VGA40_07455 [Candidatus Acidoferrales bacterium]
MIAERIEYRMTPALRTTARWILLAVLLAVAAPAAAAQDAKEEEKPLDPVRAQKSYDVGLFYFKKKNYYAAISRFREAIEYKPNFALAYRMLGECHDKRKEFKPAVENYSQYLEILPDAEDAAAIRKRIEELNKEIEKAAAGRRGKSG